MHPLCGTLPGPYVPVLVTRGALVARTSVHLCASSLQNLAVPQDFYFAVCISVERSWWPSIRWCETDEFEEQGQCIFIGLAARSLFVSYTDFPFSWFILLVGIVGFGSSDWQGVNRSLPPSVALPTFFDNNNNNNNNANNIYANNIMRIYSFKSLILVSLHETSLSSWYLSLFMCKLHVFSIIFVTLIKNT